MPAAITVKVNDRAIDLAAPATIEHLLTQLDLAGRKGIAIAIRDTVVPRSRWSTQALANGDAVVLIQATQGG